ncbi:hypothetical protein HYS00_00735 [Candidatus Microgenomates bacterium]|nr:hypothetical protein [Candidatus Microgenomates bacterium]
MSERYHNIARGRIARTVFAVGLAGGALFGAGITASEAGAAGLPCTFAADANGNGEVAPSEARAAGCNVPSCLDVSPYIDADGNKFADKKEQQAADTPCTGGSVKRTITSGPTSQESRMGSIGAANPQGTINREPVTTTTSTTTRITRVPDTTTPTTPMTIFRAVIPPEIRPTSPGISNPSSSNPRRSAAARSAQSAQDAGCARDVKMSTITIGQECTGKLSKVVDELIRTEISDGRMSSLVLKPLYLFNPGARIHDWGNKVCDGSVEGSKVHGATIVGCGLNG